MLDQTIYWVSIAGTAVDALLLGRILQLKLQRVYLFITLACVLAVLFDVAEIWFWSNSDARIRLFLNSRFVFAFVYPLVGWDVFEEMKSQISKLRRVAVGKLVSALFFATVLGLLMSLFVTPGDAGGQPSVLAILGIVLWAVSTTATLSFLWTLRRALQLQNIERPSNTGVWLIFWQLSLLAEIVACFLFLLPFLKDTPGDIVNLVLAAYSMTITGWCIAKLRAVPSDVPSESANANL